MYISSPLTLGLLGFAGTSNALMTNSSGTYESLAHARYHLVDTYNSKNIFNDFNFFDGADPTHGFVSYQNKSSASRRGLISTANGQAYMGVDHTTVNPPLPGRASVRLESKKAYNHGLFIADIAHMPGSICGVWPAWWLFGPNWPNNGEIDIIEGINRQGTNIMTLHTSPGCSIDTAGSQNGTILQSSDCNFKNANNGCGATTSTENAYGDSFNRNGGGLYAMQWESAGIYIWFFPRNNIPADIRSGTPMTGNWGAPVVAFNGGRGCDIDSHFRNHNIIFDTTFCGDWAGGSAWAEGGCSGFGSCVDYVGQNPSAFASAYWSINSVKVYQQ